MNSSPTIRPKGLSRRAVAAGLISLASLGGCANPRLFMRNVRALSPTLLNSKPIGFSRDQVAQYAAASISVRVGRGIPHLLLLQSIEGPDHLWSATRGLVIQTRGARIVATGGLQHDLARTGGLTADPAQQSLLHAAGMRCTRLLDFNDDYGAGLEAVSEFEADGAETLTILDVHIKTLRLREHVRVRSISWRHTNRFWYEPSSGRVWKSRQHTHPDLEPITMTTMRPSNA